jgi:hypothetical protein
MHRQLSVNLAHLLPLLLPLMFRTTTAASDCSCMQSVPLCH